MDQAVSNRRLSSRITCRHSSTYGNALVLGEGASAGGAGLPCGTALRCRRAEGMFPVVCAAEAGSLGDAEELAGARGLMSVPDVGGSDGGVAEILGRCGAVASLLAVASSARFQKLAAPRRITIAAAPAKNAQLRGICRVGASGGLIVRE